MTHRMRKHISRLAHAPMERVRRHQAEQTRIATIGLHLPIAYQHKLQSEPSLEETIDFLRRQPDGDHYLADVALLPPRFAMARRALRAIADQETQLLATARVLELHQDSPGILEAMWRRRLRRQVGKAATKIASRDNPDLKTIRTLGHVSDVVELPQAVTEVVTDQDRTFREKDDINVTKTRLDRLSDELTEQQKNSKIERIDLFDNEQ